MDIRLIALDIDGTLADDSHIRISERNKTALRTCAGQGMQIVLASGRPMAMMRPVAEELGCVRYVISANGSAVWDLQKEEMLISREIEPELSERILKILLDYPVAAEVYCDGHACVEEGWGLEHYEKQPSAFLEMRKRHNRVCRNLYQEIAGKAVEKFNVDDMPHDILQQVLERLEPVRENLAIHFNQCYDNLEIGSREATKGTALRELCERLKIKPCQVMAFGDSANDVTMLEYAGESFAMASGEAPARKAAKYVAKANVEDGVAEALETYLPQI